ncbi:metallophosphoesterase family protein, partial [Photobacterium sanguinicancri]|uniref:metallophosphoesterase family protein n=1 Tax=Photobacterium sanguinicancri TaxID=875932 RepID=UPI0016704B7C
VMSDAQFVARNPDSDLVAGARRALREIVAADPDVLVINGDIVDEELAGTDFPWYYVPGNHEIMGGDIANFEQAFGENSRVVDQQGTRLIMLDSSTGSLSAKFDQIEMFRDALA